MTLCDTFLHSGTYIITKTITQTAIHTSINFLTHTHTPSHFMHIKQSKKHFYNFKMTETANMKNNYKIFSQKK